MIPQRMAGELEGEFCVFLIGMRINHPLKVYQWLPVFRAMPRMLQELSQHPELGYLGGHFWPGRTLISLQYWRSFNHLTEYASSKSRAHLPAWGAFTRQIGNSGDVGIWHETYVIAPGSYEAIYHNMPPFGLGRVGTLIPAAGSRYRASARLTASRGTSPGEEGKGTP
ncbi:MAG TPA: DUF4188 domain-containing protein [Chthoniobacterales bacterium]